MATEGMGDDGRAVAGAGEVTVGSGVLDAVESLEPHPATASAAAQITTAQFTTADRTVIAIAGRTGAAGNRTTSH
jgi:hypothetical protein